MSKDRSLDYKDQKKWLKRTPEEKARLAELRKKQNAGSADPEAFAKWERAIEYSGAAANEARKRFRGQNRAAEEDFAAHLVVHMFENDAKRETMISESRRYMADFELEQARFVNYGSTEDLEMFIEQDMNGELELPDIEVSHSYWSTWHLKACLITGKLLTKGKVHRTMKIDDILALEGPLLPPSISHQIEAIKNDKYREALIALTEGHVADPGSSAERSQRRALEVLAKILNGVWTGVE